MYLPKSMKKKLGPNISLDFNIDKIINKLLDAIFGVVDEQLGLNEQNKDPLKRPPTRGGVPGITLSTSDIEIFQTRNLNCYAITKDDLAKGNFDNAVFVSNVVPVDADAEPVIVRFRPTPLLADYQLGTIDRYVLFDIRNKEIIEVSQDDYVEFRSLRYKRSYVISWYIFGKADDYQIGKYIYPGVRNNNIDVLVQAETTIPGITEYFEDKTEYLLESLDDYSGDPEIVNLPVPEDPIPEEVEIEIEEIGFGDETLNLPALPKIDLDFAEDLAGDFTAADELLGNISSSIEDILDTQDQVTAEQEALLGQQEARLRELEEEQTLQRRKNRFNEIINDMSLDEGKQAQSITVMSSRAKRRKKKRRLDQRYDQDNALRLIPSLLNQKKWKDSEGDLCEFTPAEVVEWGNETKLNIRMRMRLTSSELYTEWTRDNKSYYGRTTLYKITAATKSKQTEIPDPTINYNSIKLTPRERAQALSSVNARDRRNSNIRSVVIKIAKEQKKLFRDQRGRNPRPGEIRNKVTDRYQAWKRLSTSNQTGRYSRRGRTNASQNTQSRRRSNNNNTIPTGRNRNRRYRT